MKIIVIKVAKDYNTVILFKELWSSKRDIKVVKINLQCSQRDFPWPISAKSINFCISKGYASLYN